MRGDSRSPVGLFSIEGRGGAALKFSGMLPAVVLFLFSIC